MSTQDDNTHRLTRFVRRLGPRAWWKNLDGPPGHEKSPVWEHPNGARLHVGGLLKLPSGESVYEHDRRYSDERMLAEIMQPPPRRIRALMVWAELIMSQPNVTAQTTAHKYMKTPQDPEAAETVQTKEIPAVVHERLVRGGVTYGVTIRWTDRNGQQSCGVDGCETAEEAWEQAEGFARRCGWTPPKWWQWWRWNDTRIPSANAGIEREYRIIPCAEMGRHNA